MSNTPSDPGGASGSAGNGNADDTDDLRPLSSEEIKFTIYYDGDDHKNHTIDIGLLANSLAALDSVLKNSSKLLIGDDSDIKVEVSEEFRKGSFGVDVAILGATPEIIGLLKTLGFSFVAGAAADSVLQILKRIRGRKIDVIESSDDGTATIRLDGQAIETNSDIAKVVANPAIRNSLKRLIADPLNRPGTNLVKIVSDNNFSEETESAPDSDERVVFEATENDKDSYPTLKAVSLKNSEFEEIPVKFLSANIDRNTGWRIERDNGDRHKVRMKDKIFVERLQNQEQAHIFGRSFRVRLETIVTIKLGVRTVSRQIVNVRTAE